MNKTNNNKIIIVKIWYKNKIYLPCWLVLSFFCQIPIFLIQVIQLMLEFARNKTSKDFTGPLIFILGTFVSCVDTHMMANQIPRGAFIVFEGCDRAGKTTQAKKLVESLNANNITTQYVNFPDRTTSTGRIIDDYLCKKVELSDQAAHLLFSANRWEREPTLKKLIGQGTTLICDRYSFSGVAFSAAKKGMDLSWCFEPEKGLPKPDAVLLFKLNEDALQKRKGFGDERYEQTEFQQKVAENYEKLKDNSWIDIDADKDIDSLSLVVKDIVIDAIKKAQFSPLKQFV